ncbi:MAG: hypothetical protein IH627_13915 [Rubrivivax sp.]|nr:hypothetical protein [Rubrivivax sp.]
MLRAYERAWAARDTAADLGVVVGVFGFEAGKPEQGKFVLVLQRAADGAWQIAADMDNMNRLPGAMTPAAPVTSDPSPVAQ